MFLLMPQSAADSQPKRHSEVKKPKARSQVWYPDLDNLMVALNLTDADDNETISISSSDSGDFEELQVRFGAVEIREYKVIQGDHPFCKDGLALSLGWEYTQATSIEIKELDDEKEQEVDNNDDLEQEFLVEESDVRHDNIDYVNTRPKRLNYFERRLLLEQVGFKVEDCYGEIRSCVWLGVDEELPPPEDDFISPLTLVTGG